MTVLVEPGDCVEVMARLEADSVDAIVCDPPYHLTSIVKRFGKANSAPINNRDEQIGREGPYHRASKGFMGKEWDGGDVAFRAETWEAALRVLKPGGHLVAFSGTRTYHRMASAIEDAGFEIRDQLAWVYAQGFPKSHSVNKSLSGEICDCDRAEALPERDVRPMRQPDVSEAVNHGPERGQVLFAGLSESCSPQHRNPSSEGGSGATQRGMEGRRDLSQAAWELRERALCEVSAGPSADGAGGRLCDGASAGRRPLAQSRPIQDGSGPSSRPQPAKQRAGQSGTVAVQPESQAGGAWPLCGGCGKPILPEGLGTALKPSWEPIVLARKPLSEKSVAANVLQHGTGAIHVDACRVDASDKTPAPVGQFRGSSVGPVGHNGARDGRADHLGRWPANILHDGSDEVVERFPAEAGGGGHVERRASPKFGNTYAPFDGKRDEGFIGFGDSGSAARFFYCAKADADDRIESKHPTVKPVQLMRWLVRLVCPKGGLVLDPFAGTGTTGVAALREGCRAILIEREPEYQADIKRRIDKLSGLDAPLFAGSAA